MGYPALFASTDYLSERLQKDHSNGVHRFYMEMISISANFRRTTHGSMYQVVSSFLSCTCCVFIDHTVLGYLIIQAYETLISHSNILNCVLPRELLAFG